MIKRSWQAFHLCYDETKRRPINLCYRLIYYHSKDTERPAVECTHVQLSKSDIMFCVSNLSTVSFYSSVLSVVFDAPTILLSCIAFIFVGYCAVNSIGV